MNDDKQQRIFTQNLNSYIDSSGKSQLEIAKSIGVSPQTFNTWCKGIAIPRMHKIQLLADYFHIYKSDLLEEKPQKVRCQMPNNEYRKIFSDNLKYYMSKCSKKQSDLINDLSLSSSTISNWCTGAKLPRMDKVQLLADYFHITKSDLLEEKNKQDTTPLILQYYNSLNDFGKQEATKRVEELTYISRYTNNDEEWK